MQSLFEASMYTFVFLWTPALRCVVVWGVGCPAGPGVLEAAWARVGQRHAWVLHGAGLVCAIVTHAVENRAVPPCVQAHPRSWEQSRPFLTPFILPLILPSWILRAAPTRSASRTA